MKTISILWSMLVGFIEILVVLSILGAGYGNFEVAVSASLVIIYATIKTVGSGLGLIKLEELIPEIRFKTKVLELLGDNNYSNTENTNIEIKEAEDKLSRYKIKIYINMLVNFIIYIAALLSIFNSL